MSNLNETWKYDAEGFVWNVAVSLSGDLVAAGAWDTQIHLINRKGESVWKHKTGDYVAQVAVSRDGELVIGASYDKNLYAINKSGKLVFKHKMDSFVRCAAISSSGERIVAIAWNGTVNMLDRKGELVWKSELGTNPLSVALSADGNLTFVGCTDKSARMLDMSGKELWKFEAGSAVLSVASSPKANIFAAGSTDTNLYLFDAAGKTLWKYRTGGVVRGVALSENGEYVVATSHDRYVYFFERTGKLLWITKLASDIWTLSSSGMCDGIAIGCRDRSVRLMDNGDIVKIQLESARNAIEQAEDVGADVSEPYKLLKKAEGAASGGNTEEALASAVRARNGASDAAENRLKDQIGEKLASFEKMAATLKEAGKSPARVEWAAQRARKLLEAGRLKKALESAIKSEAVLAGAAAEEPGPKKPKTPVRKQPEEPTEPEEPAQPAGDPRKSELEKDLNNAMTEISEIEKSGADVAAALGLLEKASGAIGRGDLDTAAEFITSARKQAQGIVKHKTDASDKVAEAESAITEAGKAGADVAEISNTLKMATDAMEAGEFELAIDYASQALTQARDAREKAEAASKAADKGGKEPVAAKGGGESAAPKCPNCGKKVKPQWKSCPFCRTRLK